MKRVAIMISGGGSNMVSLAKSMAGDHPARPVLVLSNRADAGGLDRATEMGIQTAVVDHRPYGQDRPLFEAELTNVLKASDVDIVCLAGFMRVLTAGFVAEWHGRLINIHPSLLPKYRGLNTHARAIEAGEEESGCTVHQVTAELDEGPILGQGRVPILTDDTPETLAARVLQMEHQLYPAVLRQFASGDSTPVYLPIV